MSEKSIQIAVARADLILCQIGSLPWNKIMVFVAMLGLIWWVVRKL